MVYCASTQDDQLPHPDGERTSIGITWAPNNLQVVHFDFNTLGLLPLQTPDLPTALTDPAPLAQGFTAPDPVKADHLKVMVLLKV